MNDNEKSAFLDHSERNHDEEANASSNEKVEVRQITTQHVLGVAALLLCILNVCWSLVLGHRTLSCGSKACANHAPQLHSPAEAAMSWQLKPVETHLEHYTFAGQPRPELDEAWSHLLRATAIRVTPQEMREANRTSLELNDGSGEYAGYLEVFHQLHCVKRMIQFRHPEYYTDLWAAGRMSEDHFDHCIEVLRTGIMCRADLALNTYKWDPKNLSEPIGVSTAPRQCVNFDKIWQWADDRRIGVFDAVPYHEKQKLGSRRET